MGNGVKKSHSKERKGVLQHPKQNRTDNIEEELSEKWQQKIKEKKRGPTKVLKKKINAVTKDKQLEKKLEKGSLRREKGALQHPKQNNTEQELGEK